MDFFNIVLIAFSLAMDSFAVSISTGIALDEIKLWYCAKIGIFFGLFQFFMSYFGYVLCSFFGDYIAKYSHWVAFILLCSIGANMLFNSFKKENETEEFLNKNTQKLMSNKNLCILGLATSIDAMAVGVSLFATRTNITKASLIIGITAFLMSYFGLLLGRKIGTKFSKNSERVGAIVLIFIGCKFLLEHFY